MRARHLIAASVLMLLAAIQLFVLVRNLDSAGSPWFLYGRDTVSQDAVQILWIQQWMERTPGRVPLWIAELQGGIPTIGSFFWTPFSPNFLPYWFLEFPAAQKLCWLFTIWWAGLGAYVLGRCYRLRWWPALFLGAAWMLSGHLVTLIHAGHFQKVVALSWLPWTVAGAAMLADPHRSKRRAAGVFLAGSGIAMTILGGHPQICYLAICLVGSLAIWNVYIRPALRRAVPRQAILAAGAIALGLAASGAQLIPGLEMGAVSNRAGGVSFDEAVETSYPPGELAELLIPRFKGSSVFGDEYTGEWGERIVSDYAGKVVLLLALIGMLGAGVRSRYILYWMLVVVVSLVIGVGDHTPLYRLLYDWLPGFRSFRSPGTFMAAAALGFAVLGAFGLQVVLHLLKKKPWAITPLCALIVLLAAGDLARANRHFLIADSWDNFGMGYLGPNEMDVWLEDDVQALAVHDAVAELNLRPILYGRRAVNGYYPISFAIKTDADRALGFGNRRWYTAWGIETLLVPPGSSLLPPATRLAQFPAAGRDLIALGNARPLVSIEDTPPRSTRWLLREPNTRELEVEGPRGRLEIAEIVAPGWTLQMNGEEFPIGAPQLSTEVKHPGGSALLRWKYAPRSWFLGIYASGLGWGLLMGFAGFAMRRRIRPPAILR